MMGIRYFVFAVNKMDLAGYGEKRFTEIQIEIEQLKEELEMKDSVTIPVSATEGDNVTAQSGHMLWYKGPLLLTYLEQVEIDDADTGKGFYLPVQRVCRPSHDFRGFQGEIETGSVHVGDEVRILPEDEKAKIREIYRMNERRESAVAGDPVTITLDREIDVSRGSVITKDTDIRAVNLFTADILWMDGTSLEKGKNFFTKIGTIQMTCACGVIRSAGYERKTDSGAKVLREALLSQTAVTVEFTNSDRIGKELLERVEKRLVLAGRQAYLLRAEELTAEQEDIRLIEEVTKHLSDAGILTLLLVNRAQKVVLKGKGRYFRYSETDHPVDEEAVFSFLRKISSYEAEIAENRDYI